MSRVGASWGGGARIVVLAALLGSTLAGCRSTLPTGEGLEIAGTRLAVDDARADRVLRAYLARADGRRALRGSARVAVEGPDFKLNRPQRIAVERPARLRFEVIGLFDQLAALLATDGREFGFYDASSAQIARGRVTPNLLWDLVRVDLGVHEAVALLLAAPVPSDGVARAAVWLDAEGGLALVFGWPEREPAAACRGTARAPLFEAACFLPAERAAAALEDGGEVYRFDADGRLVEVRDVEAGGALRYRATFEDYAALEVPIAAVRAAGTASAARAEDEAGVVEFPRRVTVRSPRTQASARFDWKRVALAATVSDRLFRIPDRRAAVDPG